MLPLPVFQHHAPTSLDQAVALIAEHGDRARFVAGGTDLIPNMKHGLVEPEHLISLSRIDGLRFIERKGDELRIGAMTTLHEIAHNPLVHQVAPALAQAVGLVGGPHHRRMGTIGGNVCLDTRCVYYNQTYFWREALGFCLKKDGTACHVVTSGKNCVAAASNDSAPALMVLGGSVDLLGPSGARSLAVDDFYQADGIQNTVKAPGEIVTAVRVPIVAERTSAYEKLRRRGAIDYPLLNVAARIDEKDGAMASLDIVVSALAARPRRIKLKEDVAGQKLTPELIGRLSEMAYKSSKPLTNIDNDTAWRRDMVRVLTKKVLTRLLQARSKSA